MLSALAALVLLSAPVQATRDFVDKEGAFALKIPSSYAAERSDFGDGLIFTSISDPKHTEDGPHIDILSQNAGMDLNPADRGTITNTVIELVIGILAEEGQVLSTRRSEVKFDGRDATRIDATFKDAAGVPYKGWIMVVLGRRNVVVVMPYAPTSDAAGWTLVEDCAKTCAIEKKSPNAGGGRNGGLLSKEALTQLGGAMKSNLKRDSMDAVLVAGEPPLTYGSVANFVTVVELLFDIQFTEAEFNATRERFIEYYNKQDAEGKKILAQQGASLLKGATEGTSEEIEQNRREGRAVFASAFEKGAANGDAYAAAMWAAIERRQNTIGTAKGGAAKDGWDTDISEADIEATLEMLYFMWVAAGRDAADVTADDVDRIRTNIYRELPEMDPQLQLVIANAQKVYAGMRQQWMSSTMEQRVALGVQYGQALDSFGIPEGGVTQSSGGSGSDGSLLAACAQNTAWNAAKTWTTTSNR